MDLRLGHSAWRGFEACAGAIKHFYMHKPTLYEFHEAVTARAAREFTSSEQVPGDNFETVRDKLWRLMESYRWPMSEIILTEEGQTFWDAIGRQAEEKVVQLTVDQQR